MKFSTLATVLAATATYAAADTCYAVAFSSGDETAAYQAGVIKGLASQGAARVNYQAVSGVSGGAISAGILGSYV
jgi:predicted acylesterase/phospholipase RssA